MRQRADLEMCWRFFWWPFLGQSAQFLRGGGGVESTKYDVQGGITMQIYAKVWCPGFLRNLTLWPTSLIKPLRLLLWLLVAVVLFPWLRNTSLPSAVDDLVLILWAGNKFGLSTWLSAVSIQGLISDVFLYVFKYESEKISFPYQCFYVQRKIQDQY